MQYPLNTNATRISSPEFCTSFYGTIKSEFPRCSMEFQAHSVFSETIGTDGTRTQQSPAPLVRTISIELNLTTIVTLLS